MQELKELHGTLLAIIEENHKRLVSAVEEELVKAQLKIERQRNQQAEDNIDTREINGHTPLRHEEGEKEDAQEDKGHDDIIEDVDDTAGDSDDENDDDDIGGTSVPLHIIISDYNESTPNQ